MPAIIIQPDENFRRLLEGETIQAKLFQEIWFTKVLPGLGRDVAKFTKGKVTPAVGAQIRKDVKSQLAPRRGKGVLLPGFRVGVFKGQASAGYAGSLEGGYQIARETGVVPATDEAKSWMKANRGTNAGARAGFSIRSFPEPLIYVPFRRPHRGRFATVVGGFYRKDQLREIKRAAFVGQFSTLKAEFLLLKKITRKAYRWLAVPVEEWPAIIEERVSGYMEQFYGSALAGVMPT